MMISEKIKKIISQEKRNFVFFFDENAFHYEELPQIAEAGIRVVEVNHNYFDLKYKLETVWKNEMVFLYHNFKKPNIAELKKYPLLDLLIANAELKLDDASEFLSEYRLPEYHLPLVKRYINLLKTKTNQKKLARMLDVNRFNEDNLKLGLISITLEFNTVSDRNYCMAKLLQLATEEKSFAKILASLKELELDTVLLKWFNMLLDTNATELNRDAIIDFSARIKYNILTAYIDKPVKSDTYSILKLQRATDINKLQSFFQDWESHQYLRENIETVFNTLASDIKTDFLLECYGADQEFGYYSENMLNDILNGLYKNIVENPLKTRDDSIKWLRSVTLSDDYKEQLKFIYHTVGVYLVLDTYRSFKFNKAEDFINEYTAEIYKIDLNYRKAVISFDKVRDHLYEFEEIAFQAFTTLNQKYDRFLIELNVEWQQLLNNKKFNFHQINIDKQFEFYNKNLKDFDYKIVVIISDALRYELGYELYNDLLSDSKNNVTITPNLASIPSYTNIGMANLLPNSGITVEKGEADLIFKINEIATVSTNREAIIKKAEPQSACIDFSEVMKFDIGKGRDFFKNNRIVYIYHDWIDAIGDKKRTENQTFEASAKAVEDIKRLMKKIYNWNVYYVLITSDHGFLYNYNELTETSRENLPKAEGYSRDHVRFVVAEDFEGKIDGYSLNLRDTTNIDTDLKVAIPRAINRFRKQGNVGVQFVHGGASMQELLTPVIKFYKNKKETLLNVTFKRIDDTVKIVSGNLKITLLQDQPVSNDYKSAEVIFGLYSDTAELLSNEIEIHFNSTSNNPKERIFEIILSLNSKGSKLSFGYLKAFDKKDKTKLNPLGVYDLIKISSIMERDEF